MRPATGRAVATPPVSVRPVLPAVSRLWTAPVADATALLSDTLCCGAKGDCLTLKKSRSSSLCGIGPGDKGEHKKKHRCLPHPHEAGERRQTVTCRRKKSRDETSKSLPCLRPPADRNRVPDPGDTHDTPLVSQPPPTQQLRPLRAPRLHGPALDSHDARRLHDSADDARAPPPHPQ